MIKSILFFLGFSLIFLILILCLKIYILLKFEVQKDNYSIKLRLGLLSNFLKINIYITFIKGVLEFGVMGFKFKNFKGKKKISKEIKKEKPKQKKVKKRQFFDENWNFKRKMKFSRIIISEIMQIFNIKKINANIIVGFENPAHTGVFIGNYYFFRNLYPILQNLIIRPDFTENKFEGIGEIQITFRLILFLKVGYLILKKNRIVNK